MLKPMHTILFLPGWLVPKDFVRHLQYLPVRVVHGHWQFFFSLPILSFKITPESLVLEHCGEKTSCLFLAKTKEFGNDRSTPPKSKKSPAQSPRTWWWMENSAKEVLWLESLSIWPGMFPGFPTENFAYMESAPGNHRFPTPSVQGTNGDLSPGP